MLCKKLRVEPSLLRVRTMIKKEKLKRKCEKGQGRKKSKRTGEPKGEEVKKRRKGEEVIWKQSLCCLNHRSPIGGETGWRTELGYFKSILFLQKETNYFLSLKKNTLYRGMTDL